MAHRERASRAEVNALALQGTLLLSADGDGKVRAWRLDGIESSQPFVFKLRVLHEPQPDAAAGQAGVMCVAMPPPDVHARSADSAAIISSEPRWAVCGGMDGCAHVLAISDGAEQQTLRLASRPDIGWVMAAVLGYGAAGNALLLAGSYEGTAFLYSAERRAADDSRAAPAFPHKEFALARRLQVGSNPDSDGVLCVALHAPLGLALCGTNDGTLCVWAVDDAALPSSPNTATLSSSPNAAPLRVPPTTAGGLSALTWRVPPAAECAAGAAGAAGAAELLSAAEDGSVTRWRVARGSGAAGGAAAGGAAAGCGFDGAAAAPAAERLQVLQAGGEALGVACGPGGAEAYCALREPPAILPLCCEHR